jgi:hypothetical protein
MISEDDIRHEVEQAEEALADFRQNFADGKPDPAVFRRLWEDSRRLRCDRLNLTLQTPNSELN